MRFVGAVVSSVFLAALVVLAPMGSAQGITVTFGPGWMNLADWNGDVALKMRAEAVVMQAKAYWAFAITDLANYPVDVTVDWGNPVAFFNQHSNVCGVGGIVTTQIVNGVEKPRTCKIILNKLFLGNPAGGQPGNWFIDPTPNDNEEYFITDFEELWRATPFNRLFHRAPNGVDPIPCGEHRNRMDMLSWVAHEFGHTLGFHFDVNVPAAFPPYNNEVDLDWDVDLNDFGGIALGVGNADPNAASHFVSNGIIFISLQPFRIVHKSHLLMVEHFPDANFRTLMSPYDVSAVARILGLPAGIGYNLTPVLAGRIRRWIR